MRAKRSAAAPLSSARCSRRGHRAGSHQAAQVQHLRAQHQGHFQQARLVHRAGEEVDALLQFQRVAGRVAQHLVHVGDEARAGSPAPAATATRLRASSRAMFRLGAKAPLPHLTSSTRPCKPAASFLLRMLAVISGTLSTVAVRSRMAYKPPVCRRQGGRSADDGAARGAQRGQQGGAVGIHHVAGQGFQLVQRAAGVAQAAPADHRHHAAAGRHHGRQHQADLVAHTTGGVFVQHRAVQAGVGPLQHFTAARHRVGQRHRLGGVHAAQQDGHGQRGGLAVTPTVRARAGQAGHKSLDLRDRQGAAVALGADDLLRQHALRRARSGYSTSVMRGTGSGLGLRIR
jgi:hypothetical protein